MREIQYSTIDQEGVLASFTTSYVQKDSQKRKKSRNQQTLQIYSAQQLRKMLSDNGFHVLEQNRVDESLFDEQDSDRILTIAQKL
ncbi:MAG: hypothetical protein FJX71_05480 [Alphaproteobacteria bacterium]|nr:hypothetical protein [Alphaproteobacteria bacterium]